MLKMILKDYKMTWKQGIANVYNNSGFFIYIYLLVYPSIVGDKLSNKEGCIYFSVILAYLFVTLISRVYPNRLERTLYFCPMAKKEREAYVKTAYWFRVLVVTVPLIISQLIMAVVGWIPFWSTVFIVVIVFCHSLNMNLYIVRKEKGVMEWFEGWNVGAQLLGFVCILAGVMLQMELTAGKVDGTIIVLVSVVILLFVWLTTHVIRKYRKPVFETAISYEKI